MMFGSVRSRAGRATLSPSRDGGSIRRGALHAGYRVMSLLSALRHRQSCEDRPNAGPAHLASARPQLTVRWRLTLLYSVLFLICGAALLAITYWLFAGTRSGTTAEAELAGVRQATDPAIVRGRAGASQQHSVDRPACRWVRGGAGDHGGRLRRARLGGGGARVGAAADDHRDAGGLDANLGARLAMRRSARSAAPARRYDRPATRSFRGGV